MQLSHVRRPFRLRSFGTRAALVAATTLALGLGLTAPTADGAPPTRVTPTQEPGVTANLWEWNWPSVAKECTNVLGPTGYGGVQVAPPQDSVKRTDLGRQRHRAASLVGGLSAGGLQAHQPDG